MPTPPTEQLDLLKVVKEAIGLVLARLKALKKQTMPLPPPPTTPPTWPWLKPVHQPHAEPKAGPWLTVLLQLQLTPLHLSPHPLQVRAGP